MKMDMTKKQETFARVVFAVYLVLLIWIILFKMALPGDRLASRRMLNLVPFGAPAAGSVGKKEPVENLLIFVPFGAFAALFFRRKTGSAFRACLLAAACGAGASLFFEIAQYVFAIGSTDITDLITNTAGALCGAVLFLAFRALVGEKKAAVALCAAGAVLEGLFLILYVLGHVM